MQNNNKNAIIRKSNNGDVKEEFKIIEWYLRLKKINIVALEK